MKITYFNQQSNHPWTRNKQYQRDWSYNRKNYQENKFQLKLIKAIKNKEDPLRKQSQLKEKHQIEEKGQFEQKTTSSIA